MSIPSCIEQGGRLLDDHALVLVTGAAGFIGYHLCTHLLEQGLTVVGLDSVNDYYDRALKEARLGQLRANPRFTFILGDIADAPVVSRVFADGKPDLVYHLAAQAGVRFSIKNPDAYVQSNLVGFVNVLEAARRHGAPPVVFASSSSVYGEAESIPFNEGNATDRPLSLYAATKKANEVIAHSYAHLFGVRCTGLRFFTVYGPWGRPDMAYYKFAKAIVEGAPIKLYNGGEMARDFTYVDDVIKTVCLAGRNETWKTDSTSSVPFRIFNVGNSQPVALGRLVEILESKLGLRAKREFLPMQPGDVKVTFADVRRAAGVFGYAPSTTLEEGLGKFVDWFRSFHNC